MEIIGRRGTFEFVDSRGAAALIYFLFVAVDDVGILVVTEEEEE